MTTRTEKPAALDPEFAKLVERLAPLHAMLMACPPISDADPKSKPPEAAGVYLFTNADGPLYVGRTRNLRKRLSGHRKEYSKTQSAGFAFLLARKATGWDKPTYQQGEGSRKWLEENPEFMAAFELAKGQVRTMTFRYVEIEDAITQSMLEMYAAFVLKTPHNKFETT
ncbi:GIY-YIG nuclease family protein [Aureimonas sp. AU40]|uniref:GIY-YIG nuclease family protein n=1 Tax=Aureimonas sp. AU40 TaxID=1637747 RepID=UPI0007807C1C|nr:GIY-YIG nuclease family protein [Aureimonas sp. AU40]